MLDNLGVLRQGRRGMRNENLVLFDPADATRSISRGVVVDYFLKAPADRVTIEYRRIRNLKTQISDRASSTSDDVPADETK